MLSQRLAAAIGVVFTLAFLKIRDHIFYLLAVSNEMLAGFVAITACCTFVEVYAAIITGAVGALLCISPASLLLKFKMD